METIIYEVKNNIHWIILNSPPSNSLSVSSLLYLQEIIEDVERDENAKCLVFASCTCDFCIGIEAFHEENEANSSLISNNWIKEAKELLSKVSSLSKPSIAAINGSAMGFGFDLALCCDYRYADSFAHLIAGGEDAKCYLENAKFKDLIRPVNSLLGKDIEHGTSWSAREALSAGIISEIIGENRLLERVEEIASNLASSL